MLQVTRRRFTVAEYHLMAKAGILGEDDRVELIDGEILRMTPIGRLHAAAVDRLTEHWSRSAGDVAQIRVQSPIVVDDESELQPDLSLLRRKADYYASGHPRAQDVLLIVEVADSSLTFDRDVKVPLYARGGIREVWLVDLDGDAVSVFRDPSPTGYRNVSTYRRGEWLSPEALPGREIAVADLLG